MQCFRTHVHDKNERSRRLNKTEGVWHDISSTVHVGSSVPKYKGSEKRQSLSNPSACAVFRQGIPETPIFTETVVFRVAPWIMTPNTLQPEEVLVCR